MAKELQQRQNEIEEQKFQSCKAKEERRNKRKHLTVTETFCGRYCFRLDKDSG